MVFGYIAEIPRDIGEEREGLLALKRAHMIIHARLGSAEGALASFGYKRSWAEESEIEFEKCQLQLHEIRLN